MADPIAGILGRPFAEQLAAFRLRMQNLHPTWAWDDIAGPDHDRRFTVAGSAAAGAAKADLLADIAGSIQKAVEGKSTLDGFRKDFRGIVEKHGWHGWTGEGTAKGEAWRTRVIYRTNMATSYAAGRHAQLTAGNYKYWVYHHGGSEHPRLHHLSWDGVALPPDHPFWASHYPPNGWGCSCYASGTDSKAGIRRLGGDPDKQLPPGWDAISPKTGAPVGIDKGWGHAPGRTVADEINETVGGRGPTLTGIVDMLADKLPKLPAPIGSRFGDDLAPSIEEVWRGWVNDVISGRSHTPGLAGVIRPDILAAIDRAGINAPLSAEIMVAPGLLDGPKQQRHDGAGDALGLETWLVLPRLIAAPREVLLDLQTGNLLYLLDGDKGVPQLALRLDYKTRVRRSLIKTNMIVSAYIARREQLLARVAGGKLRQIWETIR